MTIKTFKGLITEASQTSIKLSTNNGLTGYKIKKFLLFPHNPGFTTNYEAVVQIFSGEQTGTIPSSGATVNFDDPTLLAAAYYIADTSHANDSSLDVVFDNVVFNQDIYITYTDNEASASSINYYLELERIKLDLNEATVATLKDMRAGPDTNFGP